MYPAALFGKRFSHTQLRPAGKTRRRNTQDPLWAQQGLERDVCGVCMISRPGPRLLTSNVGRNRRVAVLSQAESNLGEDELVVSSLSGRGYRLEFVEHLILSAFNKALSRQTGPFFFFVDEGPQSENAT